MKLGDKIRLTQSKEEGIISKIINNNVVKVRLNDGFELEVGTNEITILESKNSDIIEVRTSLNLESGQKAQLILALVSSKENVFDLHIINTTPYDITYTLSNVNNIGKKAWLAGTLKSISSVKVNKSFSTKEFDLWKNMYFQGFYFSEQNFIDKQPIDLPINLKPGNLFDTQKMASIINQNAIIVVLDEGEKQNRGNIEIDVNKLKNTLSENAITINDNFLAAKPANRTIDLHIEKVSNIHKTLDSLEILDLQLKYFSEQLDIGIISKFDEMIFIHGIGDGILKAEIRKLMTLHKNVSIFYDAPFNVYGKGATLAKII